MAGKGANFTLWLRDRLMKRFDLFRPEAVYMDCVMSRLDPRAQVGMYPRPHVASITQAHPIGARLES